MNSPIFYREDYEEVVKGPQVLLSNRAFLYGEGAMTCSLFREGQVLFLRDHIRRLEKSWLSFYPRCPRAWLRGKIVKNLSALPRLSRDCFIKVCLFANDKGRGFARKSDDRLPNMLAYGEEYTNSSSPPLYLETVVRSHLTPRGSFLKTPTYLTELADLARVEGDDILYLDSQGYVLEASVSNIFFIKGDWVMTPPLGSCILPGIARKHFIEMLNQTGIPFRESPVHSSELTEMEGIVLSNSLSGLRVVGKVDGRKLQCLRAEQLQDLYNEYCNNHFEVL